MADFGINATQLSAPQGQGTEPIAPVETRPNTINPIGIIAEGVGAVMDWKKNNDKKNAADRKAAVLKAYVEEENKYSEAFKTGQWDSNRAASASRANYAKFIAGNSDLIPELAQARAGVYVGTEMSEVEKQQERAAKLEEKIITDATSVGYQFYPGMSPDAKQASMDSYQSARRVEEQIKKTTAAAQEARAQAGEGRAAANFGMTLEDRKLKEEVVGGLRTMASMNFDAMQKTGPDLMSKVKAGNMTSEQALQIHQGNMQRVQAGITSIGTAHPELAGPYTRLFGEMDLTIKSMLDPGKKTAEELKALQDKFNLMVTQQKVMALEKDPALLKAYTASQLFSNDSIVTLGGAPAVSRYMMAGTGADPSLKDNSKPIGTGDDAEIYRVTTHALKNLYAGKVQDKEAATIEATNLVNKMLKDTASVEGSIAPTSLKKASEFYASPEFGKLAIEGKVDKQTAANAQEVFQVRYEPAVREAIMNRLNVEVSPGQNLLKNVKFDMSGNNIVIIPNIQPNKSNESFTSGFIDRGMQGINKIEGVDAVKQATAGLNQLVRLHAHLEGTTDYAKYWEKNKHQLMPGIFPNPTALKPGQVEDGYEYLGGNYQDPRNWKKAPKDGK
jgi:hypothetical protein